jgi:hypothetical protein
MAWLQRWFGLRPPGAASPPRHPRRCRPAVEALEDRALPTVTFHGGPVLAHVEVEALFLGSGWSNDPNLATQGQQVEIFLQNITNSTFMDALGRAGYRVGRGGFLDGAIDPAPLPGTLDDVQIQQKISAAITGGVLQTPDANRLYFVFVAPGVEVTYGGDNSITGFYGYHDDFTAPGGAVIPYAVIAYPFPGGGTYPGLSVFETLTKISAHELAESATDPQGGQVGPLAWVDMTWRDPSTGQRGGEIADITNNTLVDLNGYVVQAFANKHDQAVLPGGASWDPRFRSPRQARHTAPRRHKRVRHPLRTAHPRPGPEPGAPDLALSESEPE